MDSISITNKFTAVFYRHHAKRTENFDSLEDALNFLEHGGNENYLSPFAIVWNGKICWINTFYKMDVIELECKEFLS